MIKIKLFLTLFLLFFGVIFSQNDSVFGQSAGDKSGYLLLLKKDQLNVDANGIPKPLSFKTAPLAKSSEPVSVATKPDLVQSKEDNKSSRIAEQVMPSQMNFEIREEVPKAIEGKYEPVYETIVDKTLVKEAYAKWEPSDEIAPNCFSANKDDCRIPKLKNYPAVYKEVEKTFLVEALPTVFYVKMVDTIVVKQASAKWEFSNEYDPNCISANKEDCRIPKLVNYSAEYGYRDRLGEWVNYKKRNYTKEVFVKKYPDILLPEDKSKANGLLANAGNNKGRTVSKAVSNAVSKEDLDNRPGFPKVKKDSNPYGFMENIKPYEARYKTVKEKVVVKEAFAKWEPSLEIDPNCVSANKEDCRIPKLVNYPAEYETKERQKEIPALGENYIIARVDSKLVKPAYSEWIKGTKFDPNCVSANKEDCLIPVLRNFPPSYEPITREESWILYKGKFYTEEEFTKAGIQTLVVRVEFEEPPKKNNPKVEGKQLSGGSTTGIAPKAKSEKVVSESVYEEPAEIKSQVNEKPQSRDLDELRHEVTQAKNFPTPTNRERRLRTVQGKTIKVYVSDKKKPSDLNLLKPEKYEVFEADSAVSEEEIISPQLDQDENLQVEPLKDKSLEVPETPLKKQESRPVEELISNELKNSSNSNINEIADDEQEYFLEKEPVVAEEKSFFQRLFSFFKKDKKEDYFNKGYIMGDPTGLMPKDSEPIPVSEIPEVRKEKLVIPGNNPSQDLNAPEKNYPELRSFNNNLFAKEINPEKSKDVAIPNQETEKEVIRQFVANYSKQNVSLIQKVQVGLRAHGYNPDRLDNKLGKNTMSELVKFQDDNGILTGGLNAVTLKMLGIQPE
jgi:hypothetical protein